jgi:hypothetical protein
MIRKTTMLAVLTAIAVIPASASALDLFEGNLGFAGDWLDVYDSAAMNDRVYWYELGDEVTYQAQFSASESFLSPLIDIAGIEDNFVTPALGPGFYHFRVREAHRSGAVGSWSDSGTLEILEDRELPIARVISPSPGQNFERLDEISIVLEVADDTLLRFARFTAAGDYAGTLGLKAENGKLSPSRGTLRAVTFDFQIPKNAGKGSYEILIEVTDVMDNAVSASVVVNVGGSTTSTEGGGKGQGRGKKR